MFGLEQALVQRPGKGRSVREESKGVYSYYGGLFNHFLGKTLSTHKASMAPRHLSKKEEYEYGLAQEQAVNRKWLEALYTKR